MEAQHNNKNTNEKKHPRKLFDKLKAIGNFVFDLSNNIVLFETEKDTGAKQTKRQG